MLEKNRDDIQGMIFSAYVHLECAAYLLLRVTDAALARKWVGQIANEVTNAVKPPKDHRPPVNINIAFTATGLTNLGVPEAVVDTFSYPFRSGMATERRANILGDSDANHPKNWEWGNDQKPVDVVLMVFAQDEFVLKDELERRKSQLAANGLAIAAEIPIAGRQPDSREHFGFNDGIGQPTIAETDQVQRQQERTHHATPLPPGEVLLGHENVYGTMTPSVGIDPSLDPKNVLPPCSGGKRDLGFNGSYLVFRQMEQDVATFWNFANQIAGGDEDVAKLIGAKMVGRWESGASLALHPHKDPNAGTDTLDRFNDFNYEKDPEGYGCPVGSHVRRANPRDTLGPTPDIATNSANRHRIMRRGRSYGHRLEGDRLKDDGQKRGLHFICFNGDIERQFEFVQQTWINNSNFAGLGDEVDPLLGDQLSCSGIMTIPSDPLRFRVHNLCRFVTIRGGAYFFLPGIRALRWIAAM